VSGPAASRSSKLLLEAFSFHPEAAYGRAYCWAFRAPACAIPPLGAKNLTPGLSNMLMRTPTRKQGATAGRDHPRPSSIGMGGRLRSEFPADFFGPRNVTVMPAAEDRSAVGGFKQNCQSSARLAHIQTWRKIRSKY
jgi:hypothetical protein